MAEFNTGRIGVAEFHRRMCARYELSMDLDTFKRLWCEIFYTMEGMEELVGQIKQTIIIGLLSDTDPIHWNHIRTTWPWIAAIANPTVSYEIGVMKPNPEIYRAAAANVRTPTEHCLFVDDLQDNVNGARAVGMSSVRFESVSLLREQLRCFIDFGA
jgi:putative hydrolase of the HAD superfamily